MQQPGWIWRGFHSVTKSTSQKVLETMWFCLHIFSMTHFRNGGQISSCQKLGTGLEVWGQEGCMVTKYNRTCIGTVQRWLWWCVHKSPQVINYIKLTHTHTEAKLENQNKISGLSMSTPWLSYYTALLQNVTIGGNWTKRAQDVSVSFLTTTCKSIIISVKFPTKSKWGICLWS